MKNQKIVVHEIESVTPGGRHYWLITSEGKRIRKPIGSVDLENYDFSAIEKNKIVFVENRLLHWGKWLAQSLIGGISYPSQSTLVTALQGSPSTAVRQLPENIDAEQVDAIINSVAKISPKISLVLRKHYTRDHGDNADKIAANLEIPWATYKYCLNMGRKKVEFYLKRC